MQPCNDFLLISRVMCLSQQVGKSYPVPALILSWLVRKNRTRMQDSFEEDSGFIYSEAKVQ